MSRVEDVAERALAALVTRIPGAAVAAIVVLVYASGLALPLALHWSIVAVVEGTLSGTVLAGLVGLAWFVAQLEARDRRHLVEWTSNLRLLNSEEFEWLVGEVFRRDDWQVSETGQQDGSDGNVDLRMTKGGQRMIVQCKRWTSWQVGVDEIRQFAGTLMREGLPGSAGTFVTLSGFTAQALTEGRKIGMTLLDRRELYARVEEVRRPEACPQCQAPMVLDRSGRGWWFRCVIDGCSGKRDLSSDPGRAVELLTEAP
jgi:restriction system protein